MQKVLRGGAAALAMVFGLSLDAAAAETAPGTTPPAGAQSAINPSADQSQAFMKALEGFATQAVQGLQQSVGAKVPAEVQTTPMPAVAAATLPEAKDHHIVKPDDDTVVIVDPVTREIVSVITALESGSQQNTAAPPASK